MRELVLMSLLYGALIVTGGTGSLLPGMLSSQHRQIIESTGAQAAVNDPGGTMTFQVRKSKTFSVSIGCPPERVYAFVSNPENLPKWIAFIRSVRKAGHEWIIETTEGTMGIRFVPANAFGVLDHTVTPGAGVEILNPMRVIPNGQGSEVIFTLFQLPEMSDQKFLDDAALVDRDLRTLKSVLDK